MTKKTNSILSKINKKYGEGTLRTAADIAKETITRLPTGILSLDIITNGGIPQNGRITLLVGKESSGKTTLLLMLIASAQRMYPDSICILVDAEKSTDALNATFFAEIGVDMERLYIFQPDSGEEAGNFLDLILKEGLNISLIGIDSIASLIPTSEIEIDMEKGSMGKHPLMMNRIFKKIVAATREKHKNCSIVFTNQVREKIGVMYGPTESYPGGHGKDHFNSMTIKLQRKEWLKDDNKVTVGMTTVFTILKSKVCAPMRTGEVDFYFQKYKGRKFYDNIKSIRMLGVYHGLINFTGKSYSYKKISALGKSKFEDKLRKRPKLMIKLQNKILEVANKKL